MTLELRRGTPSLTWTAADDAGAPVQSDTGSALAGTARDQRDASRGPVQAPPGGRAPRVAFEEPVRLVRMGRPAFVGQGMNVSTSGMLVRAPTPCPVGAELLCDVPLPGGVRMLRARVARVQPLDQATALGIKFVCLTARDQELLVQLVRRAGKPTTQVSVRFDGMPSPVRCRARVDGDGLQLTTKLAFLRVGSQARVAFDIGDAIIESPGQVTTVDLQAVGPDGTPRLRVGLALPRPAEVERLVNGPAGRLSALEAAVALCARAELPVTAPSTSTGAAQREGTEGAHGEAETDAPGLDLDTTPPFTAWNPPPDLHAGAAPDASVRRRAWLWGAPALGALVLLVGIGAYTLGRRAGEQARAAPNLRVITGEVGPADVDAEHLRGIDVGVPSRATSLSVVLGTPTADDQYVVQVTPSWPTTLAITAKTAAGFTIAFGTPAPEGARLDWIAVR